MRQVLFHIPIYWFDSLPDGIPIYGYGMMLFLAFVFCTWVACWRGRRIGVAPQHLQDVALWLFAFGILGARITFMIQYHVPPSEFLKIWDGGLVFYGSFLGGMVGYAVAYYTVLRKYNISTWKMADIVAPCVALGLCLGRLGCFLNGCCYGNVACGENCPRWTAVHFPLSSPARYQMVDKGYQTAAGFTLTSKSVPVTVDQVEPGSDAYAKGLRPGDEILAADGRKMDGSEDTDPLSNYLTRDWPRGQTELQLRVRHRDGKEVLLEPIRPQTLGLHPTQLYESISMLLLFLLLCAYFPFRRRDGSVMVLFMICYAVHRFLNEMLRDDTDPVAFGMTLSQNISILMFLAAVGVGIWLWRKPAQYPAGGLAPA
jgi:phosphatidylglycerol:prolipoprotein diacylglycerol transferase